MTWREHDDDGDSCLGFHVGDVPRTKKNDTAHAYMNSDATWTTTTTTTVVPLVAGSSASHPPHT